LVRPLFSLAPPPIQLTCRGYRFCFGSSVVQFHPLPDDPLRNSMEISLGQRHLAAAITNAANLTHVTDIVDGFHFDLPASDDAAFIHHFQDGEVCSATQAPRSCVISYYCDTAMVGDAVSVSVAEPTPCAYRIVARSSIVCPYIHS
jgi:hypothetical protein